MSLPVVHGFLKVRVSGFLYTDFADPTDFFVFHGEPVLSVRSVYRNWFLSTDNEKTIDCCVIGMSNACNIARILFRVEFHEKRLLF